MSADLPIKPKDGLEVALGRLLEHVSKNGIGADDAGKITDMCERVDGTGEFTVNPELDPSIDTMRCVVPAASLFETGLAAVRQHMAETGKYPLPRYYETLMFAQIVNDLKARAEEIGDASTRSAVIDWLSRQEPAGGAPMETEELYWARIAEYACRQCY